MVSGSSNYLLVCLSSLLLICIYIFKLKNENNNHAVHNYIEDYLPSFMYND